VDINEHGPEDIGFYVKFTQEEMEKYFSKQCFGSYKTCEYIRSKTFGIMCTEENLTIVNYLKAIMEFQKNPNPDFSKFLQCKSLKEVSTLLKDEEIYPLIYHSFAINLIDSLKKYRKDELFQRLFHTSPIFDALVNIMVQELRNIEFLPYLLNEETRKGLFDQLLFFVEQNADHSNPNPLDITYFLKTLNMVTFKLPNEKTYIVDFKKYKRTHRKFPSNISNFGVPNFQGINSGLLLHGVRGSGKSGALIYSAMWAHKMGWVVVSVPNVHQWTQIGEFELRRHHKTGLYLQQEYAVEFLEQFKTGKERNILIFFYFFKSSLI